MPMQFVAQANTSNHPAKQNQPKKSTMDIFPIPYGFYARMLIKLFLFSFFLENHEVNATSQSDLCGAGIDMRRANLHHGSFVCNLKNEIHPKALYVRPDRPDLTEKKKKEMKKRDTKVKIKTTKTFAFTSMAEFLSTLQHSKVLFYIYEDDAITMNSFHEVCEWNQPEDAVLANLLRNSKWRTNDPSKAKVFFILIPYHQSYFCGSNAIRSTHVGQTYWTPDDEKIKIKIQNWDEFDQKWQTRWANRTHLERVERAVTVTKQLMKKYSSVPHVMPAFSWQSSAWNYDNQIGNYKEASQIFPLWCWQALANVILVRFEVFGMSPFYNSFSTGRLAGRTPSSMYNVLWEQTKRAVILPFVGHRDMPHVDDLTYTEWKTQREFTFWYHTTTGNSAHGGTRLRHLPVQHAQRFGNDSSVGFGIPRKEWLSGFSRSKFCLVVRGDDPNSHSWIAALKACCIPVFISDHFADVCLPFGDGINGPPSWMPPLEYFAFSVKESEVLQNPQRMVDVVLEASEAEVEAKLKGLLEVRKYFMYEHPESLLVEALVWGQVSTITATIANPTPHFFERTFPCTTVPVDTELSVGEIQFQLPTLPLKQYLILYDFATQQNDPFAQAWLAHYLQQNATAHRCTYMAMYDGHHLRTSLEDLRSNLVTGVLSIRLDATDHLFIFRPQFEKYGDEDDNDASTRFKESALSDLAANLEHAGFARESPEFDTLLQKLWSDETIQSLSSSTISLMDDTVALVAASNTIEPRTVEAVLHQQGLTQTLQHLTML